MKTTRSKNKQSKKQKRETKERKRLRRQRRKEMRKQRKIEKQKEIERQTRKSIKYDCTGKVIKNEDTYKHISTARKSGDSRQVFFKYKNHLIDKDDSFKKKLFEGGFGLIESITTKDKWSKKTGIEKIEFIVKYNKKRTIEEALLANLPKSCQDLIPYKIINLPPNFWMTDNQEYQLKHPIIIMPYVSGDLMSIDNLNITQIKKICYILSINLLCLQKYDFYYFDIKRENIFYSCKSKDQISIFFGDLGSMYSKKIQKRETRGPGKGARYIDQHIFTSSILPLEFGQKGQSWTTIYNNRTINFTEIQKQHDIDYFFYLYSFCISYLAFELFLFSSVFVKKTHQDLIFNHSSAVNYWNQTAVFYNNIMSYLTINMQNKSYSLYHWLHKDTNTIFNNTKKILTLLNGKNQELISGYKYSMDDLIQEEVNFLLGKNLEEDQGIFDFIIKGLEIYEKGRVPLQKLTKYLK
tara:strand:+ start:326 stop:1723 length:1398 start_codon:yes stop_codon:yes gene_type:complete